MAQFEKVPPYVAATQQQVAEARKRLALMRVNNPAFDLQRGYRRSAIQAKFNSGMLLTAIEYVEFSEVIPPGYSAINISIDREYEERQFRAQLEFAESQRRRREEPHPMTQREAQNMLSPDAYNKWIDEHQDVIARSIF
jgi:hypothetical protein